MSDASGSSRRRRSRRSRRSDQHDAAHGAAELDAPAHIPDHPDIPAGAPQLIDDCETLEAFCAHVREAGLFAYDTEFIGEESYFPQLCLIQLATCERIGVVDALAPVDLTPVWEMIADPALTTIVHAGQQDLEPVVRLLDRSPAAVFDTQIGAGFLDRPYPMSLRQLVRELVGVSLGKALTFTRWDLRPVSDVHLRYAADDVRYLPALAERIRAALAEAGYLEWVDEECAALADPARYRFDAGTRTMRILGKRSLRPRGAAVLRELVTLREELAREQDVPPRTLLADEVLVRVAKSAPAAVAGLLSVKGMPRPIVQAHGDAVLAAVCRGADIPTDERPRSATVEETPEQRVRIDGIWNLICAYCQARGVDARLITSRREIAIWLVGRKQDRDALSINRGWRGTFIGELLDGFSTLT